MSVDFAALESMKENIQPIKSGRNVSATVKSLSSKSDTSREKKKQEWETYIAQMSKADDPLPVWKDYIDWLQEAYPSGSSSVLIKTLERCLRSIKENSAHFAKYRNNVEYVKLWLSYADLLPDPADVFKFLHANKIGEDCSILYIAWAWVAEVRCNYPFAAKVFTRGMNRSAQPLDRLQTRYREFQRRMYKKWIEYQVSTYERHRSEGKVTGPAPVLAPAAIFNYERDFSTVVNLESLSAHSRAAAELANPTNAEAAATVNENGRRAQEPSRPQPIREPLTAISAASAQLTRRDRVYGDEANYVGTNFAPSDVHRLTNIHSAPMTIPLTAPVPSQTANKRVLAYSDESVPKALNTGDELNANMGVQHANSQIKPNTWNSLEAQENRAKENTLPRTRWNEAPLVRHEGSTNHLRTSNVHIVTASNSSAATHNILPSSVNAASIFANPSQLPAQQESKKFTIFEDEDDAQHEPLGRKTTSTLKPHDMHSHSSAQSQMNLGSGFPKEPFIGLRERTMASVAAVSLLENPLLNFNNAPITQDSTSTTSTNISRQSAPQQSKPVAVSQIGASKAYADPVTAQSEDTGNDSSVWENSRYDRTCRPSVVAMLVAELDREDDERAKSRKNRKYRENAGKPNGTSGNNPVSQEQVHDPIVENTNSNTTNSLSLSFLNESNDTGSSTVSSKGVLKSTLESTSSTLKIPLSQPLLNHFQKLENIPNGMVIFDEDISCIEAPADGTTQFAVPIKLNPQPFADTQRSKQNTILPENIPTTSLMPPPPAPVPVSSAPHASGSLGSSRRVLSDLPVEAPQKRLNTGPLQPKSEGISSENGLFSIAPKPLPQNLMESNPGAILFASAVPAGVGSTGAPSNGLFTVSTSSKNIDQCAADDVTINTRIAFSDINDIFASPKKAVKKMPITVPASVTTNNGMNGHKPQTIAFEDPPSPQQPTLGRRLPPGAKRLSMAIGARRRESVLPPSSTFSANYSNNFNVNDNNIASSNGANENKNKITIFEDN